MSAQIKETSSASGRISHIFATKWILWGLIVLIILIVLGLDYIRSTKIPPPSVDIALPTPKQYEEAYTKVQTAADHNSDAVKAAGVTVEKGKLIVRPDYELQQALEKWNNPDKDVEVSAESGIKRVGQ
jgi:hypothetical protein